MMLEKFKLFAISSFSDEVRQDLFSHVWHHYSKRIMFYISLVVPRWEADSEDLFQEIMLKIYRNLEHHHPLRSFRAWVFAVSRNHCLDYLKTRARRVNPAESTHQVEVADNRTPEQLALRDESRQRIHDLLQALSPLDREIAYLRFHEGLKYREIGRILNKDINNIKVLLYKLKNRLKEKINEVP